VAAAAKLRTTPTSHHTRRNKVAASDVKSPTATGTAFQRPPELAWIRASIQWGLLGLTGAIAAGVGV